MNGNGGDRSSVTSPRVGGVKKGGKKAGWLSDAKGLMNRATVEEDTGNTNNGNNGGIPTASMELGSV